VGNGPKHGTLHTHQCESAYRKARLIASSSSSAARAPAPPVQAQARQRRAALSRWRQRRRAPVGRCQASALRSAGRRPSGGRHTPLRPPSGAQTWGAIEAGGGGRAGRVSSWRARLKRGRGLGGGPRGSGGRRRRGKAQMRRGVSKGKAGHRGGGELAAAPCATHGGGELWNQVWQQAGGHPPGPTRVPVGPSRAPWAARTHGGARNRGSAPRAASRGAPCCDWPRGPRTCR
jgi:hypothetical protein